MAHRRSNKVNKKKSIKGLMTILSIVLTTIATGYLLYSLSLLTGIETKIRILVSIDLFIILIGIILYYLKQFSKRKVERKKKSKIFLLIIFTFVYSFALAYIGHYIIKTYKVIDNMTSDTTTYSSSLVTLSSNKVGDIANIGNSKIGILKDDSSNDGYIIPKEIMKEENLTNDLVEYDSYVTLIQALMDKKIDYVFLPTTYVSMFSAMDELDLSDVGSKTKIIYTKDKKQKSEKTSSSSNLKEPFTVLIMGVDSEKETLANSSFNGDSLLLITFNPKTLNTTMLSIPRDSYVPIACFSGNKKSKITHAAWYGESCMMKTISNYTGININYFVKVNFKGVVNIIDSLGGVDVDVPYSFCEQNSNRDFGNNTIYVEKGIQKLNGEQALALSRNRKSNSDHCSSKWTSGTRNDFVRGQNQQLVLRSILNKLKEVKSLDTIYSILDKVSASMTTNMTTNEILSLYNVGKDIIVKSNGESVEDLIGIQKLYLNGRDARIYDSSSGLNLYNYLIYDNSLKAVVNAMKANLGLSDVKWVKEFSFSINNEYKETVIGKSESGGTSLVQLPSFVGMTESAARTKVSSLGVTITVKYATTGSGTNGTVLTQDKAAGTDITYAKNVTLTVLKKETITTTETTCKVASNCVTQSSCTKSGFVWSDGKCNPKTTTESETETACTSATNCTSESACKAGGFIWSDGKCNPTTTDPEPTA